MPLSQYNVEQKRGNSFSHLPPLDLCVLYQKKTMSFQLNCPNCGKRAVSEFTFKSELKTRPAADADFSEWTDYVYFRENNMGPQTEWWFHSSGCQSWFLVERDTTNNTDHRSFWYNDSEQPDNNG